MKILAICGMGLGSSLMLKMTIDEVLAEAGIEADVEACDLGSAQSQKVDYIVATEEIGEHLQSIEGTPVILVANVIDRGEVHKKLAPHLNL